MDSNWCMVSPIISAFILLQCFISSICLVQPVNSSNITHNFRVGNESRKSNYIEALLKKINKPAVKTFQTDGDVIDCVPTHLQPAFDHPLLKGQKPLTDPTEMPKGQNTTNMFEDSFQVWSMSGESCPENTVPIKRTTEQDVLRATSVRNFGQKTVRRDSDGFNHDHALGYVTGSFFGAKANISIWHPIVEHEQEFSLSQIWVTAGQRSDGDLNSIEVGWQVFRGDRNPRLFIYWTRDDYQRTGCYNVANCTGFVQTSRKIVVGGEIKKASSYNGAQYDLPFFVWKDRKTNNWWLQINNEFVGYWPSFLFTRLKNQASTVEFGGEVVNVGGRGSHTKTEMGSGHFPEEGFRKAAFIRNIQLVDNKNVLYSAPILETINEKPKCYSVKAVNKGPVWGSYLFYGGPGGGNPECK